MGDIVLNDGVLHPIWNSSAGRMKECGIPAHVFENVPLLQNVSDVEAASISSNTRLIIAGRRRRIAERVVEYLDVVERSADAVHRKACDKDFGAGVLRGVRVEAVNDVPLYRDIVGGAASTVLNKNAVLRFGAVGGDDEILNGDAHPVQVYCRGFGTSDFPVNSGTVRVD